jgi:hypothetical protein
MARKKAEVEAEERARLRRCRTANYRIKREHGFACAACGLVGGILVVRVEAATPETPERFEPRCDRHRDGMAVAIGQLVEVEYAGAGVT